MSWVVANQVYEQNGVIIGDNGKQDSVVINCCALQFKDCRILQYPRAIIRNGIWYQMIKYSEGQDLVIYKKRKKQ